jgi:16S rRNA processing protein RimM
MVYREKNYRLIGKLIRAHGVKGAIALRTVPGVRMNVLDDIRWCFLQFRDKPVPFRIREILSSDEGEIILMMDGFDDKAAIEELLGHQLFIESIKPVLESKDEVMERLAGYAVSSDGKIIGKIDHMEDTGAQLLFALDDDVLIPAHEDLIERIDEKTHTVYMNIPEGLI